MQVTGPGTDTSVDMTVEPPSLDASQLMTLTRLFSLYTYIFEFYPTLSFGFSLTTIWILGKV